MLDEFLPDSLCKYGLFFKLLFLQIFRLFLCNTLFRSNDEFLVHFSQFLFQFLYVSHLLHLFFLLISNFVIKKSEELHQVNFLVMIYDSFCMISFADFGNQDTRFSYFLTFLIKLYEWIILSNSVFAPSSIGYQTTFCSILTKILSKKLMELIIMMTIFMLLDEVGIVFKLLIFHEDDIIGQAVHTYDVQHGLQYTGHSGSSSKESFNTNQSPILLLAISIYVRIFHDFVTLLIFFRNLPPISILVSIFLHKILTVSIILDNIHTTFLILYDNESSSCYVISEGLHNQLLIFRLVYLLG